jgi:HK97 family phage prohead protease
VFDQWTTIDSIYEGRFIERIAEGAFKKTISENRAEMRMLFQHGRDPQIGDKPLAPIEELGEDQAGGFYAGQMLDTSYNRDLIPGLEAGLYGSSFRFAVTKEEFDRKPRKSAHNPEALPERTIREVRLMEFGPVTFPAYAGASAGIRSLTDEYVLGRFLREPERFVELLEAMRTGTALPGVGAAEGHSDEGSREAATPPAIQPITDDEWHQLLGVSERSPEPQWLSRT